MKNLQIIIVIFTSLIIGGAIEANAATWMVTKSTDSNDNICDADCSLREAVFNADSGDTVLFNSNLIGQTFTLGGSQIVINKQITIDGNLDGVNVAFISGGDASRIFYLNTNNSALNLKNAILVQGNSSAIFADVTSSLSLDRVRVAANSSKFGGAVTLRNGTHHITNTSFSSNTATSCSAIELGNGGNLYMANVTVTNNHSGDGGGIICNSGSNMFIRNSTIVYNDSDSLGAIFIFSSGKVNIGNSIVAQNTASSGADFFYGSGMITSVGGNLIGNLATVPANTFNQSKDIFGVNPLLAPTNANQGGHPVFTHPLQAGSPARNGGINAIAVDPFDNSPLTNDARGAGFPRIAAGTVDKGAFEDQTGNTSLIVTKNTDTNDLVCDVDCSLREAVHQAALNFGTDTITFAANVFGNLTVGGGSEVLIQNQNVNIVGYPSLSAETLRITGTNTNRIFHLNNATVTLSGMALTLGNAGAGFGGAILSENNSNLTLDRMIIRNNFATAYGAVYFSGGTGRITNSTINNNSANSGLALGISGTLNMANTTVSGNFDADGDTGIGAIFLTGTANIRNSTIAFNRTSGGTGGGIFNAGTLNIGNSIVADNIAAVSPDIHFSSGLITSVGGNLISNSNGFPAGTFSQTNDAVNTEPLLNSLSDNGGIVTTHALQAGSPALNSGVNANAIDKFDDSILTTDARGYQRIVNSIVDKGAFESLVPTAATVSVSGRITNGKKGIAQAQVYLNGQNGEPKLANTDSFGYFTFADVPSGQTYIINIFAKHYSFSPQILNLTDDLDNLNFVLESAKVKIKGIEP